MRKIFLIAIVLMNALSSSAQKDNSLTFQAEIANRVGDVVSFYNVKNKMIKTITVDKNGIFKDTMNVEAGRYYFVNGEQYTIVYLKNGFDLQLKLDVQKFDESLIYKGKGAVENNFLAQSTIQEKKLDIKGLLLADEAVFYKTMDSKKANDLKQLDNKKLDPVFVDLQKKSVEDNYNAIVDYYKKNHETFVAKNKLNNTVAPPFDYLNHKGGNTKLEDLKGKYVYVDVWATWCGPCRAEIPHLKKMEEKYNGKNIAFVSISVDTQKDFEKWKSFVTDKNLGGVQLFADKDWNSDFIKSFGINSIPRFILIDPNGKVVQADASRPSSPQLKEDLDKLLN
ncbi:MAG: TlpA disulfide reductase family protein [Bacteroidota bacterium]